MFPVFSKLPSMRSLPVVFLAAILFSSGESFAQPGENVDDLQRQLRQIQSRIESLQGNDDQFGKRVRSVGRQRTVRPDPVDEELTIRFYDLSDVFSVAPQYPAQVATDFYNQSGSIFPIAGSIAGSNHRAMSGGGFGGGGRGGGGGFGGGGGGVFNMSPAPVAQQQPQPASVKAARVSIENLVAAVQDTVAPDEWADTNGDSSVSILGNTLLISATESMHEQIANLLDLFREQWGKLKTISVQAFWIESDSTQIAGLLESDAENPAVGKVAVNRWAEFFRTAGDEGRIAYSASVCGQNGQTLHTVSGQQHFVVLNAEPIYTFTAEREDVESGDDEFVEQSVAGLLPVRTLFQEGAALQISPLATRGGKFLILDLHTRVNEFIEAEDEVAQRVSASGKSGQAISMDLDNRSYVSYRLSTTVRCPNNEVVLAGGMTYDSNQQTEQPNLYLFVKTAIHTIEEDRATNGD